MSELKGKRRGALVVGASGGIGGAVLDHYLAAPEYELVFAVSRGARPEGLGSHGDRLRWLVCDYSESSIESVMHFVASAGVSLARVVICNGILHNDRLSPEKSLLEIKAPAMEEVLRANVVIPSLWIAALPGLLRGGAGCAVAVLSARVGSISDNRLGGWYSYRASKAALNMVLRSAALEYRRRLPRVKLLAFHPGTTDTALSRPFQRSVAPDRLFTPAFVAGRLAQLLDRLEPDGELSYLAWDGSSIEW
ncbi:MAG: SDR family NAD(P)-dependent oxidoreductase [Halieaceae bacterium]|jgi:NAD(P)-dependent dehydrogenase (short-subunit alcohol dehydrogenase family)|nr:SDR family NAD(P)-dependent oxidoreductase [Halieaceae bacterium]